mgnify:CR=1 FL=1
MGAGEGSDRSNLPHRLFYDSEDGDLEVLSNEEYSPHLAEVAEDLGQLEACGRRGVVILSFPRFHSNELLGAHGRVLVSKRWRNKGVCGGTVSRGKSRYPVEKTCQCVRRRCR